MSSYTVSKYGAVRRAPRPADRPAMVSLERIALEEAGDSGMLNPAVVSIILAQCAARKESAIFGGTRPTHDRALTVSVIAWLLLDDDTPWEWYQAFSQ